MLQNKYKNNENKKKIKNFCFPQPASSNIHIFLIFNLQFY